MYIPPTPRVATYEDYLNLTNQEDLRTTSNCCGAGILGDGGLGEGICSACHDHCVSIAKDLMNDPMNCDDLMVQEDDDAHDNNCAGFERGLTADRSWQ